MRFKIGEVIYLKTDPNEQVKVLDVWSNETPTWYELYEMRWGTTSLGKIDTIDELWSSERLDREKKLNELLK
jgi:hypothetical protein